MNRQVTPIRQENSPIRTQVLREKKIVTKIVEIRPQPRKEVSRDFYYATDRYRLSRPLYPDASQLVEHNKVN